MKKGLELCKFGGTDSRYVHSSDGGGRRHHCDHAPER